MGRIQVQMIDSTVSFDWWRKLLQHFVSIGNELEIRCWKEETEEIQKASLYGIPMEDKSEVSVRGVVTVELLSELLEEEPADKSILWGSIWNQAGKQAEFGNVCCYQDT